MEMLLRHLLLPTIRLGQLGIRLTVVALVLAIAVQAFPHKAFAGESEPAALTHVMHHVPSVTPQQSAHAHHHSVPADQDDSASADCGSSVCCAGFDVTLSFDLGVHLVVFVTRTFATQPSVPSRDGTALERPPRLLS
jgi:hypothetical protein